MGLFNFGKKKEEVKEVKEEIQETQETLTAKCSCGSECSISDIENAKIIVLGACCKKSQESFENTKKAVEELGLNETVVNIGDMAEIAKYGVMQTPALVVNSKVVCYGKLIKVEEAKSLIAKEI